MEKLISFKYIKAKCSGNIYKCEITEKIKEITCLDKEFVICANRNEAIFRIEYNGISICGVVLNRTQSIVRFTIRDISMYMGNIHLLPEFNNSIINKIYKYLKELQDNGYYIKF